LVRPKNWRLIAGGLVFIGGSAAFFFVMLGEAHRSTDPSGMLAIVGQVSGVVGVVGFILLVAGLLGWQGLSKKS
jgi:hypothetical protein